MTRKQKQIQKRRRIQKILLFFILFFSLLTVFYPLIKTSLQKKITSQHEVQMKAADIVVYPGSSEKLYTKTQDRLTVNLQTLPNVDYHNVVSYYIENLPKLGWELVSTSETDAVFTKGSRKLRIWILYVVNNEGSGVDYIIDFTPDEESQSLAV